jgi:glycosyltransferase involved in cell wall biosynthesis
MKPTRVLRLIARLNVGGPARHVVWLHEALSQGEYEPILVTGTVPAGEEDMRGFATEHGVTPVVVPSMSREMSPRDLVAVWDVWRLMVRFRPDLVHTHTAKAGAVGRLAGLLYRYATPSTLWFRPRRCRFVHTYHGHIFHHYYGPAKTRLVLFIERMLARMNTDRIVVLGKQQFEEICDRFKVGRPEQFVVVPLGIDLGAVEPDIRRRDALRAELGIAPGDAVVGIVGRLAPIKNHALFLRVAARCRNAARFVIFGDGGERSSIVETAARLGIEDRVTLAGLRDAKDIYSTLDILALTSQNEGTPLAIIEAMAAGKPVIATSVGGVVDLLGAVERSIREDGVAYEIRERGITATDGDDASFAAGLLLLLHDEVLRHKLCERGKAYVIQQHGKDRLVRDILAVYRALGA